MAKRKATAKELEALVESNGYKRGTYREEDSTRDNGKYDGDSISKLLGCCAQQTGLHVLVVEALLIDIFLSDGRANTYRHRKYDRRVVLPVPLLSASPA